MKFKKLFSVGAFVAAASLMMVGCGTTETPAETPAPPATTEPAPTEPTEGLEGTITFAWWGNDSRHEATREIAQIFMDENPGVTINFDYGVWGGWQERITTDLMGGTEADLLQVNFNWLALFSPEGTTFADLEDPVIAQYLDLSNWTKEDIDMVRRNGIVQAVPSGITARVPFMRRDLYERAGLDIQDINTWDDLMAAGRTIQAELGDDYFALSPLGNASLAYMVFSWLEQYTGRQFVDENNQFNYSLEELTQGFQLVEDLVANGVVARASEDNINAQNPRWIAGNYGGVSEWDSSINAWIANLDADGVNGADLIEVRPHFTMEGAKLSGVMARPSMGFAISRNSQHPEIAAAFLNFMLTDPRAIEIQGTDRGVPANLEGLAHFNELVAAGEIGGAAIDAFNIHDQAETTIMSPVFEFQEVRDIYEIALEDVQEGRATAAEAAARVYNSIQEVIDSLVD